MELIFLNRKTMQIKDHSIVGTEWELVMDLVVSQKSSFTLNTNKINAKVGDIAILKNNSFNYLGVVDSITNNKNNTISVQLLDFKELLNIKMPVNEFSGNISTFLKDIITKAFITNTDELQNIKYLNIECKSNIEGVLIYKESLVNIKEIIELLTKKYGLNLSYEIGFDKGKYASIKIIIDVTKEPINIRYDLALINNLVITDSSKISINKFVFYPKKDNKKNNQIITYYLLNDNTITTDKNSKSRYDFVISDCDFYTDGDYEKLADKASEKLTPKTTDHQITFTMKSKNNILNPMIGLSINFISKYKTYKTIITQLKFKNTFDVCNVTLGEYRVSLTDKLKLIKQSNTTATGSLTIQASSNIDGGDY